MGTETTARARLGAAPRRRAGSLRTTPCDVRRCIHGSDLQESYTLSGTGRALSMASMDDLGAGSRGERGMQKRNGKPV